MGLGIDLTLLAIDAEPGYLRVGPALGFSLVVGELVDLAVAGRITLCGELIEVLDRTPIGDVLTDDSLTQLADIGQRLSVEQWLQRRGRWRVEAYLAGLRYEHVLRDSSAATVGKDRIVIADTLRAAAPAHRLRTLIGEEREYLPVQDLAFAVLAYSTGWPQARWRRSAHRGQRARLKRWAATVAGSAEAAGFQGDAGFAVLRHGVQVAAKLAEQSLSSGEHTVDRASDSSPSIERSGPLGRRGLRLLIDLVALLALATLVLACLTNVPLAIIIAPFAIILIALPVVGFVERRGHRRRAVKARDGEVDRAG